MPTLDRRTFLALAAIILFTAALLRLADITHLPPGPHYDEAVKLLVTRTIVENGAVYFPMIEAYQGREPLYFYLGAPFIAFVQDSPFAFRLLSTFVNLITIAASMTFGRALLPGARGRLVGLAIGVMLAVSFHHVWLSRQIFRAVSLPMMQALALACLFLALRARRRVWIAFAVGAGVFAGGALYTYNASRLFPLWVGAALGVWLIAARFSRRALVRAIVIGVVMTVTAAPMLLYAVQRPDVFFGRLAEVTQPGQSVTLAESLILHARMFFIEGDPYFRYNLSGRPYLTAPEGLLMLIGLGAALTGMMRRGVDPAARAGYALALLSPLMVIPSVISVGGLPPSHMRSLGMIPPLFALVAFGAEAVARAPLIRRRVVPLLLIALAIGAVTVRAAYLEWATSAAVFYETDADLAASVAWAGEARADDERVYIAARDKGHPTAQIARLPDVAWLGTDSLILPPPGASGVYLFPRSAPPQSAFLPALESGRITDLPLAPDGRTAFEAFRVTGQAMQSPPDAPRSAVLRFIALDAPPTQAGERALLTATWSISAPPPSDDFTPLIEIIDAGGTRIARGDAYVAGASLWRPGETLMQQVTLTVPPFTPPGTYRVRAAWVMRAADRYAPFLHPDGSQAGIWADVGTLTVTRPAAPPDLSTAVIALPLDAPLSPSVRLLGTDALPAESEPGAVLPFTLWLAFSDAPPSADLTLSLSDGAVETPIGTVALAAGRAGDLWAIAARPRLPITLADGAYTLTARLGDRQAVTLATLIVRQGDRMFTPPDGLRPIDAVFGGQIALIGWSLTDDAATGDRLLTLAWRAERPIDRDYTFFVHLLDDADGSIAWQIDAMPRSWTYPTTRWLPGEIVTEVLVLPKSAEEKPVSAALRTGWYDADTGLRLTPTGDFASRDGFVTITESDF
jgi:hypothetical protein